MAGKEEESVESVTGLLAAMKDELLRQPVEVKLVDLVILLHFFAGLLAFLLLIIFDATTKNALVTIYIISAIGVLVYYRIRFTDENVPNPKKLLIQFLLIYCVSTIITILLLIFYFDFV